MDYNALRNATFAVSMEDTFLLFCYGGSSLLEGRSSPYSVGCWESEGDNCTEKDVFFLSAGPGVVD